MMLATYLGQEKTGCTGRVSKRKVSFHKPGIPLAGWHLMTLFRRKNSLMYLNMHMKQYGDKFCYGLFMRSQSIGTDHDTF